MKTQNLFVLRSIPISLLILLINLSLFAQKKKNSEVEFAEIFSSKAELVTYSPDPVRKYSSTFWIDSDTLFTCQSFGGAKISLSDIDFNRKTIQTSQMLAESTKEKISILKIFSKDTKKAYSYSCMGSKIMGILKTTDSPLELEFITAQLADGAFNYLRKLSGDGKIDKNRSQNRSVPSGGEIAAQELLDSISNDLVAGDDKSAEVSNSVSTEASRPVSLATPKIYARPVSGRINADPEFDEQLYTLIDGLKDNFQSLKGERVEGVQEEYKSKVQLKGALRTRIITGLMKQTRLFIDFGRFKTMEEALPAFMKFASRVEESQKMPADMVRQKLITSPMSNTFIWLPIGETDPALNGLTLKLEQVKSFEIDDNFQKSDVAYVQLIIAK